MSLCAACGCQLTGDAVLCPHHLYVNADQWHVSNRIWCDLLHRGLTPVRLAREDRRDFWTVTEAASDCA